MNLDNILDRMPASEREYYREALRDADLSSWQWPEPGNNWRNYPQAEDGVHCGAPTPMHSGAAAALDNLRLMEGAVVTLEAQGDSMTGVGIEDGDRLELMLRRTADTGDIVVANLDGELTVKTLVESEDGTLWLVPQNPDYDIICMSDYNNAFIVGCIVGIHKRVRRSNVAADVRRVNEFFRRRGGKPNSRAVARALKTVVDDITSKRMWFGIYRVLADRGVVADGDFSGFVELIESIMGKEAPELDTKELSRLNVLTFSKPLPLWDVRKAPMQAARAAAYLQLARRFDRALR